MAQIITEKNYPIQKKWIYKLMIKPISFFIILGIAILAGNLYEDPMFRILIVISFIGFISGIVMPILNRKNYHYIIEEKFLTLKQGILSKQQKHIPYGVIQNVFIKQDFLDRILGLTTLIIENASSSVKNSVWTKEFGPKRPDPQDEIGFEDNKTVIPGLLSKDAEILKNLILQKMKENPIDDKQSGL